MALLDATQKSLETINPYNQDRKASIDRATQSMNELIATINKKFYDVEYTDDGIYVAFYLNVPTRTISVTVQKPSVSWAIFTDKGFVKSQVY